MNKRLSSHHFTEKGQALILIVFAMMALIGLTALSIDGARLYTDHRRAQSAADAAALAAALAKCTGKDSTAIVASAMTLATSNGFNNNGTTNTVTVNNPPSSGAYKSSSDKNEYVEVIITAQSESGFAGMLFKGKLKNTARAVGHCDVAVSSTPAFGSYALVALNRTASGALSITGTGDITIHHAGAYVDSSSSSAARITGTGSFTIDQSGYYLYIVGGYQRTGTGNFSPTPKTGQSLLIDPFTDYPLLPPTNPGGTCTTVSLSGTTSRTINPGVYCSITNSGTGTLTLNPGNYWITSGGLSVTGTGDVIADNVVMDIEGGNCALTGNGDVHAYGSIFFMGPSAGSFSISGNGNLLVQAPTSGQYEGMMLYVDPDNHNTVSLTGNGSTTDFYGTTYAPSSAVALKGNGSLNTLHAQVVGDTVTVSGNGDIYISFCGCQFYTLPNSARVSLAE